MFLWLFDCDCKATFNVSKIYLFDFLAPWGQLLFCIVVTYTSDYCKVMRSRNCDEGSMYIQVTKCNSTCLNICVIKKLFCLDFSLHVETSFTILIATRRTSVKPSLDNFRQYPANYA